MILLILETFGTIEDFIGCLVWDTDNIACISLFLQEFFVHEELLRLIDILHFSVHLGLHHDVVSLVCVLV